MARNSPLKIASLAILLSFAIAASSCGRRGALEAPATSTVVTTDDVGNPVKKPAPKPDRPFILDGLI